MGDGTTRANEWHWVWDAYVVGVCATAIVAVFLLNDRIPGNASAAAALLAGVVAWELTVGRGVSRVGALNWRTATFVAVVLVMSILAVWFSRVAVVAVPAIYPIIFSALPMLTAIVVTTAFTVTPLAIMLVEEGFRAPDIPLAVAITLLGVVAAPLIGVMVVTATRQRFQLAAVVSELEATRAESARLSREASPTGRPPGPPAPAGRAPRGGGPRPHDWLTRFTTRWLRGLPASWRWHRPCRQNWIPTRPRPASTSN
jgi:hypothetical protein